MTTKEYYEHPAINQSKLKLLLISPKLFTTSETSQIYFEEPLHFVLGSGVDCMLTDTKNFSNKYHVSLLETKPSDKIKSIINQVFDIVSENITNISTNISDYASTVLRCCDEQSYQTNWLEQTRCNKIYEHNPYWLELLEAQGKQVLSVEEYDTILKIVQSLQQNPVISKYFDENTYEIIYQLPIIFFYKKVACKALIDMVCINHKNKTIQLIDIKTTGDYTSNFEKSVVKRRYDIQSSFYLEAIKYYLLNSDRDFKDYTLLDFKFIVESTKNIGCPLLYNCNSSLLGLGKYGRETVTVIDTNGKYQTIKRNILGFDALINLYEYHLENGFLLDKITIDNNFLIDIGADIFS